STPTAPCGSNISRPTGSTFSAPTTSTGRSSRMACACRSARSWARRSRFRSFASGSACALQTTEMTFASLRRRILDLWAVRLVMVVIALFLAVLLRDILTGILAGALHLGEAEPELWLGRPRTPTTMTAAGAIYALVGFALTVVLGYGAFAWCVRRL